MSCDHCHKRLSRKTARLIDGKTLCSSCVFGHTCPDCGKPRGFKGHRGPECQCDVKLNPAPSHSIKASKEPV